MTTAPVNYKPRRSEELLEIKVAQLEAKLDSLEEKMDKMLIQNADLLAAWNTAKGMTSFVKWLASLATAAAVILALFGWRPHP